MLYQLKVIFHQINFFGQVAFIQPSGQKEQKTGKGNELKTTEENLEGQIAALLTLSKVHC